MREAAEKKKELEKQHGESVNELRTAQAQLGLLANNKNTEVERAQHSQNIESLQVPSLALHTHETTFIDRSILN